MSHPPAVPGLKVDVTVILHAVPSGAITDGAPVICELGEELVEAVGGIAVDEGSVTQ
jgi:hypothetical protein